MRAPGGRHEPSRERPARFPARLGGRGTERRRARWAAAAEAAALGEYRLDQVIGGLRMLAFGRATREAPVTVVAYVARPAYAELRGRSLPALEARTSTGETARLPLAVEPFDLAVHTPFNPSYATLGCWIDEAPDRGTVLAAGHALGADRAVHRRRGAPRPLPWYAPGGCLDLPEDPLPGDRVDVFTSRGAKPRRIDATGRMDGSAGVLGGRVFVLDAPLEAGDAGSLVRPAGAGAALGVYLGALTTSAGALGLCLRPARMEPPPGGPA